jgi:hypothetical protein
MALLSYVCPESTTITGSRNMVRVMGHMSSSGSASRSASGASGRSPGALVERRVRTPELAFPDVGCETADVLRRFEGAIERTPGVAASPALGTLRDLRNFEIRESASSGTAQNWSRRVSTQETVHARHEISPALGTLRISAKRRLYYK